MLEECELLLFPESTLFSHQTDQSCVMLRFLWARLLLDEICSKNSDKEILATLDNLPTKLSDLFSRILQRVTLRPNAAQAIKVLQCA